ncbi:MAG: hypothetical protein JKX81_05685 [Arenicella sp.]|nr:hypothetical protein [Arenicella sp.]
MLRLFILLTLVFFLAMFVRELRRYFTRDQKEEELRETFIEGDLVDIELEIAEEKARQEDVRSEMDELKSKKNNNSREEQSNDKNSR